MQNTTVSILRVSSNVKQVWFKLICVYLVAVYFFPVFGFSAFWFAEPAGLFWIVTSLFVG